MVQMLGKTVGQFRKRLNIELQYDPAMPLLGLYPREMKMHVHTNTCKQIFIAAIFITKNENKPNSHQVINA